MGIEVQARQWLIAAPGTDAAGEVTLDIAGWRVILGAGTSCIALNDAEGVSIGCLLGEPIDIAACRFLAAPARMPMRASDLDDAGIEHWLAGLGGAFVALLATRNFTRVYQSASRTCVWREDAPLIAAAPLSLLSRADYDARLDRELVAAMEVEQQGWLPAGLTSHADVHRLLPNHYFDLEGWESVRHWSGPVETADDPAAAIAQIGEIMAGTLHAVAARYRVQLAFTAGRDSRAVLAACRDLGDRLEAFTIGHDTAGPDRVTPVEICEAYAIPHQIIAQRLSTDAEQRRWLALSGHCVGGANLRLHRTVGWFGADEAVVTGAAGEVGRGFYWNAGDTPETVLTPERLLARMDLKPHPKVVAAMRSWLAGLHGVGALRILDLAYVEHRLGCWSSPQSHGYPEACFHFAPLDQRRIFDALMALPPPWRRSSRYIDALIEAQWPQLARWPYNRFAGWRQVAYLAGKALSYERVRRKLRRHVLGEMGA